MTRFRTDRRGATALEFALCCPAVLLVVFGLFTTYSLVSSARAINVGVMRALRHAAVNSNAGPSGVETAFRDAAGVIWASVGKGASVSITPSTFRAGDTVSIAISYAWAAPARLSGSLRNAIFERATLTGGGSVRVVN